LGVAVDGRNLQESESPRVTLKFSKASFYWHPSVEFISLETLKLFSEWKFLALLHSVFGPCSIQIFRPIQLNFVIRFNSAGWTANYFYYQLGDLSVGIID
jgi:hypothetical protein